MMGTIFGDLISLKYVRVKIWKLFTESFSTRKLYFHLPYVFRKQALTILKAEENIYPNCASL